jgi:hypothetical protein
MASSWSNSIFGRWKSHTDHWMPYRIGLILYQNKHRKKQQQQQLLYRQIIYLVRLGLLYCLILAIKCKWNTARLRLPFSPFLLLSFTDKWARTCQHFNLVSYVNYDTLYHPSLGCNKSQWWRAHIWVNNFLYWSAILVVLSIISLIMFLYSYLFSNQFSSG